MDGDSISDRKTKFDALSDGVEESKKARMEPNEVIRVS